MGEQDALRALATDRSIGASEITRRALAELGTVARSAKDPARAVLDAGVTLVRAQPAMAPLFNLVNEALLGLPKEGPAVFDRLAREAQARERALHEEGAGLFERDQTVATYSRSGSLLGAVKLARRSGRELRVLVSEGRPGDEGIALARELATSGARVTLCVDAALPALLQKTGLVVVGADALCARGLVNKVGTGLIASAALEAGVPFVVLAATDKLLPSAYAEAPAIDVTARSGQALAKGVEDRQPLFEIVPWERVGLVVTEEGRLVPRDVPGRVVKMRVAGELVARLKEGAP